MRKGTFYFVEDEYDSTLVDIFILIVVAILIF